MADYVSKGVYTPSPYFLKIKTMSTLKQELQIIVDEDLLNKYSWYICNNLSKENRYEFEQYKEIASNYGKEDWKGGYAWWEEHTDFVISEKYRFIKDLIKTL